MKIHEYNEMMSYLMRPATGDREKFQTGSNPNAALAIQKKAAEKYGLSLKNFQALSAKQKLALKNKFAFMNLDPAVKVSKNIRKTPYGKFQFSTETFPPISKTFETLEEAEAFRNKSLLERGVKSGARRVSDPKIGKYKSLEGQKQIKFNGATYEVLVQRAGQDIKPKYFKTLKEAKEARDNLVKEFPPQKQRGVVSDKVMKKARDKRKTRIATTAPLAATGTKKFAFHHIMPIGGEVPLTTNDIAVINQKMNGALSGFNRELNSIADGITNAYNKQPPDLKRVDQLNKAGESIVKKASKELPKEYRKLIGFNKLEPIFDEYGTVINLNPERVGGVNQKQPGIKLEDLTKDQATALRKQIKTDALSFEKVKLKDKILSGTGKVLKGVGKVIKPIGYAVGTKALFDSRALADEQGIELSIADQAMALDSGDANIAIENYKRRTDPEFAAQERAKDLAQMMDDFEDVGLDDIEDSLL